VQAWSSIVYALVPNVAALEVALAGLADACDADEVVLFEKSTFLVVSSRTRRKHRDMHRFEKMSNIIKQLKLACMTSSTHLESLQIANGRFRTILAPLTDTTIVMIVTPRPGPCESAALGGPTHPRSPPPLPLPPLRPSVSPPKAPQLRAFACSTPPWPSPSLTESCSTHRRARRPRPRPPCRSQARGSR